jgi:hypothetical protein
LKFEAEEEEEENEAHVKTLEVGYFDSPSDGKMRHDFLL